MFDLDEKQHASLDLRPKYQLPRPFTPPSLSSSDATKPRPLPIISTAPGVPTDDACKVVDSQDVGTPDGWIPRDPRMTRLTGKHPFNAEAKLGELYAQGFLTPSKLFFVRNHGAVPEINSQMAAAWRVQIHGLCENPISFSLSDLTTNFKVVTIPITLVCAGNRRKEQNTVRKSLGFSWGAGGVSTALFTGVYLADILEFVRPTKLAKHVVFEGGDQLPAGPYGTSQLLTWAKDPQRGMMLTWAMNGIPLEPDHGYPIRLVVPGQIGGRSVKWLKRIELSAIESQHHLHFHDNKVLPMSVTPDRARAEKHWWLDPRYIIRDLNVNSAIACPDHDEVVETEGSPQYVVKGYAYAGGGRRITRVEITIDDGRNWVLATIHYAEDRFRDLAQFDSVYGHLDLTESDRCFCWCFWSLEIPLSDLKKSSYMAVRAMDESLSIQPRDMYLTALGMMTNWWFRVCIHKLPNGKLRFEHPTMANAQSVGWMQRLKNEGQDPAEPQFSASAADAKSALPVPPPTSIDMKKPGITRKVTMKELTAHATPENPWFVVQGEVYDATEYLKTHPGGPQSITLVAGEDATEDFMAIHSADAKQKLAQFHVGTLAPGDARTFTTETYIDDDKCFLHPKKWKTVSLVKVQDVSKDSKIFRFVFDRPDQRLGLPIGQHVYIRLKRKRGPNLDQGEVVQRAYTPLSRQEDQGFIDMLVKIYYPNKQYPLGGKMTVGFSELTPNHDVVELKGPVGHFVWEGNGIARVHGRERRVQMVNMICGGSGITPILQVLRGIFEDERDKDTHVRVLDVNRHIEDILCKAELDALAEKYQSRLRIRYSLTGPAPNDWDQYIGRADIKMVQDSLYAPTSHGLVGICGPPLMEEQVKDMLVQLGWDETSQIVIF